MILAGLGAFLMFALADDQQPRARPVQEGGMVTVRQQFIIRVTGGLRLPAGAGPAPRMIEWRESRGPRCIPWSRIAGAAFPRQSSVDLILRDRTRFRARLERRCAALDFYRSFYVSATADGLICADRDSIRSRTGGECQIDQFRALRAEASR